MRAALLASLVLAILVVNLNVRDLRSRQQDHDAAVQTRPAQKPPLFGWGVEPTLRALRPPAPSSVFIRGIEEATPTYWDVGPQGVKEGTVSASMIAGTEIGPFFDLESLVRILVGLVAITLGVEAIGGDRANGTLTALLSQPVTRSVLAAGKLLGGTLTIMVAVGLVVLAGGASAREAAPEFGFVALHDPLLAFAVVSAVHLVTLYASGMVVGALIPSPAIAMTMGVSVWIVSALAVPALVVFGAQLIPVEPRPSAELRMVDAYTADLYDTQIELGRLMLENGGSLDSSRASPSLRAEVEVLWRRRTSETRKAVDAIEQAWQSQVARRQQVTRRLSWISPSTIYMGAAAAIAGTGEESRTQLNAAIRAYKMDLNHLLFDDQWRINSRLRSGRADGSDLTDSYDRHTEDRTFPLFQNAARSQRTRWNDSQAALVALFAYFGVAVTVAILVFPRRAQ